MTGDIYDPREAKAAELAAFADRIGISSEGRGDEEYHFVLPFSGLERSIYEGDEAFKASEALGIIRLMHVKQLSFLTYVGPDPEVQYPNEFTHNRHGHSFLAAIIMEEMLTGNGASEQMVQLGIDSAIAHDKKTPALGDATKKVDRDRLNEEDCWDEEMPQKGWAHLRSRGITWQQMDDAIHSRGLMGQVLDIADKISYVMLDVGQIIGPMNIDATLADAAKQGYKAEIAEILKEDPSLGSIYKDVRINFGVNGQEGEVYFADPRRLGRFLKLRALLNKYLYMHPVSQARDQIVVQMIKPYYSTEEPAEDDDTKLTPKKLRRMTDDELMMFIATNRPEVQARINRTVREGMRDINSAFIGWFPQYWQRFDTLEQAEDEKRELEEGGEFLVNGTIYSKRFNPATDFKVLGADGKIVRFKENNPELTDELESIADSVEGHLLFWQDKDRETDYDDVDLANPPQF
jgi:hypothetical protein